MLSSRLWRRQERAWPGVGVSDGQAHGEQAGRYQGRGAGLAGQRERFVRQRDRPRRITDEHVTGYGDGEFEGGVGEVAAGPRLTSRPTTLTSRITTKPAPASAAITTLPLRGIDLQGHPHTWPGHGNRGWHLRDCRAR